MFSELFMQRALAAAAILGPLCGLIGVFVTARRMAFFSDTISHGALAGIALGFWWGLTDPTLPMIFSSIVMAAAIIWLKENTLLLTDTIMALLLSGSVAFGIIVLSLMQGYRQEIHRYLFGDILAIGSKEVFLALILAILTVSGLVAKLNPLVLLTTHEDLAHVCGVPVRRLNYAFMLALTMTVAISIRLLGIILVTSLIVIPPATARNLSRSLRQELIWSAVIGLVSGLGGIAAAYHFDVPCGPAIVLVSISLFAASLGLGRIVQRASSSATSPSL